MENKRLWRWVKMRKILSIIVIVLLFTSLSTWTVYAAEGGKSGLLKDLTEAGGDSLNKADLSALSGTISKIYDKYKFSDNDISELGASAATLVLALSDFSEKMESSEGKVEPPRGEMKKFFGSLGAFLKKYKVSAEDTILLGRDVAIVAMGAQDKEKGGAAKSRSFSRENMVKISSRLAEFSKKHAIAAEDLVPILENLGDIGISVMQNEEARKKLEKTNPHKAQESSGNYGLSQDQIVGLINSLLGFQKKYRIDLGEMVSLVDDIRKMLK
jgi:hypothetical protein